MRDNLLCLTDQRYGNHRKWIKSIPS